MDAVKLKRAMKKTEADSSYLWTKCPKCNDIVYTAEVAKLNRCPAEGCDHIYSYPFAKALELKKLLRIGTTWEKVGKFVLKVLDSIKDREQKIAFLSKSHGLMVENFEWHQMKKKKIL